MSTNVIATPPTGTVSSGRGEDEEVVDDGARGAGAAAAVLADVVDGAEEEEEEEEAVPVVLMLVLVVLVLVDDDDDDDGKVEAGGTFLFTPTSPDMPTDVLGEVRGLVVAAAAAAGTETAVDAEEVPLLRLLLPTPRADLSRCVAAALAFADAAFEPGRVCPLPLLELVLEL